MPDCFASMSPPSLSTTTYTPITPPSSTPSPPPSPASILSPSSFNPTLPTPQPRPQPPPAFPPLSIIKILSSWIATRTSFFDPVASPRPRAALLPASPTVGRVGPRVSIPADGSCMYWAVAAAWLGLPEGANISPLRGVTAYRRSLANHGAAETREARGALFDSFDSEAGFEAYLVEAASWRTYRGAFELDTLCRELGFQVLVLHRGGTLFEMWQRKKIGKEGPRFVLRLDWGHYCLDPDAAGFGGWTSQIPAEAFDVAEPKDGGPLQDAAKRIAIMTARVAATAKRHQEEEEAEARAEARAKEMRRFADKARRQRGG